MTIGNGVPTATDSGEDVYVRDDTRQLRDIEELVAKLRIVSKQLALLPRSASADEHTQSGSNKAVGEA